MNNLKMFHGQRDEIIIVVFDAKLSIGKATCTLINIVVIENDINNIAEPSCNVVVRELAGRHIFDNIEAMIKR